MANNIKQIYSQTTLEEAAPIINKCPFWGLGVNKDLFKGGALRYLILSSFNQLFIIAIEGFNQELLQRLSAIMEDKWFVTENPQRLIPLLKNNGFFPLPQMVDYSLPRNLVNCGKDVSFEIGPKLPPDIDELGTICRSAYFYLTEFTNYLPKIENNGLTRILQLECSLMPVLAKISAHGFYFSTPTWDKNSQIEITGEEHDKWETAKGLVNRDLLPNLGADNRLHSHYDPLGAATGRISSNGPNLQSIPSFELVRQCFTVPEGYALISADYSGAELRILAQLSREPLFLEAFHKGLDFHSYIAQQVFGVPVSKDEHPELRKQAKVINFGLAYGMGPSGLAQAANISLPAANKLLAQYKRTLPVLFKYLQDSSAMAIENGFASTIMGRRRYLDGLGQREAERIARNTPIQGSCADIIKIALIRLDWRLKQCFPKAAIVNTVHDEIVIEAPQNQAEAVAEMAKMEMGAAAGAILADVPMSADVTISSYWKH